MNTNPTQFTLEVGLTLKTGLNLIELVRVLDCDKNKKTKCPDERQTLGGGVFKKVQRRDG